MNNIDLSTPLPPRFVGDSPTSAPRREGYTPPAGYEARLALLAETWGVELDVLLHKGYKDDVAHYEELERELEEFAALPLPTGEELRGMTDAQRRKALRDVESDNVARAQIRSSIRENLNTARRMVEANESDQLTYNHVLSFLPVAETVDTLNRTAKFIGPYTTLRDAGVRQSMNAAEREEREAANEVIPVFREALFRVLSLDLLIGKRGDGYALFADPNISGFLTYRLNMSVKGEIIGRENDFTDADVERHRIAKDWHELYVGGWETWTKDLPGRPSQKLSQEVRVQNTFFRLAPGDRAVTALARGRVEGLELSVPETWQEYEDRLRRYDEAMREAENREGRFSKDAFKDSESNTKNPNTGEWEKFIHRTNLRTGEREVIRVGSGVPEPKFAPRVDPVR